MANASAAHFFFTVSDARFFAGAVGDTPDRCMVETARTGKIALFPDHRVSRHRRFAEWESALGADGPIRPPRYLNSGALALSLDHWRDLPARWRKACERLRVGQIGRDPAGPFWTADQDALNALLMSEVPPEAQVVGAERQSLHPDALREVVVLDGERLSCSYRGATPAFLRFSLAPKAIEAVRDGSLGQLRRLATSVAAVASPRRAR